MSENLMQGGALLSATKIMLSKIVNPGFTAAAIALIAVAANASTPWSQSHVKLAHLSQRDARIVRAIQAVLAAQVAAWNSGNIEAFMEGYARSPETIFVSDDTVRRGWQTVLDRYRKTYNSPEKMGRLEFSELEVRVLSPTAATALGRWQLTRAGDALHGRFTLVFRRFMGQWRIVHDHTSSASN